LSEGARDLRAVLNVEDIKTYRVECITLFKMHWSVLGLDHEATYAIMLLDSRANHAHQSAHWKHANYIRLFHHTGLNLSWFAHLGCDVTQN